MAIPGVVAHPELLDSHEIRVPTAHGDIRAYLSRPKETGSYPAVLVIHEAFGLNDHIRDVTRRFAARGYIALAPDLYSVLGPPSEPSEVMGVMFRLRDEDAVHYLEQSAARLRQEDGANGKVGCIGFCSGGRHALLYACRSRSVDAAVDCWGGFIRTATPDLTTTPERPVPIMSLADGLQCPLLVVIGTEDKNPSPEDGEVLSKGLQRSGQRFQINVYDDAGHAFFADYRPSYREAAAHQLWEDANHFFDQYLR